MRRFLDFVVQDAQPDPDADDGDEHLTSERSSDDPSSPSATNMWTDINTHNPDSYIQPNTGSLLNMHSIEQPSVSAEPSSAQSRSSTHLNSHVNPPSKPTEPPPLLSTTSNLSEKDDSADVSTSIVYGTFETAPIISSSDLSTVIPPVSEFRAPTNRSNSPKQLEHDEVDLIHTHFNSPLSTAASKENAFSNVANSASPIDGNEGCTESSLNISVDTSPSKDVPTDLRSDDITSSSAGTSVKKCADMSQSDKQSSASKANVFNDNSNMRKYDSSPSESQLRSLAEILSEFSKRANVNTSDESPVLLASPAAAVNALRELAEVMVWADQHDHTLWDTFMECSFMSLLSQCLNASKNISDQLDQRSEQSNVSTGYRNSGPVFLKEPNANFDETAQSVEKADREPELSKDFPTSNPLLPNGDFISLRHSSQNRDSRPEPEFQDVSLQEIIVPFSTSLSSQGAAASDFSMKGALYDTFTSSHLDSTRILSDGGTFPDEKIKSKCIHGTGIQLQSQILQSLSIIVQSVLRRESLFCLFSSNHINNILSFPFSFENEEMQGLLMSTVKTIALRLDHNLLQFFFDPVADSFPLYVVVVQFYNHPDTMVRIAVRNTTLTLCALEDSAVLEYIARDDSKYLQNSVIMLKKLCGSVARAFEILLDDGREVARTRTRTGLFRRSVRISDVEDKLQEIENLCGYFSDLADISRACLYPTIIKLLSSELFAPLFRPLASYASPTAVKATRRSLWSLSGSEASQTGVEPALPMFDAAARMLLLAFVLSHSKRSAVSDSLMNELIRPAARFGGRHVLHALKAIAADISGTERMTFVALAAIRAIIECGSLSTKLMHSLDFDFETLHKEIETVNQYDLDIEPNVVDKVVPVGVTCENDQNGEFEDDMLMTLHDFDVPTTPTLSRPLTPIHPPVSPGISNASSGLLFRSLSSSASLDETLWHSYAGDTGTLRMSFENGTATLQDVLSSIVVVPRRREVRTNRVLRTISLIMLAVAEKTWDWSVVADLSKEIIMKLALTIKAFVNNRSTTIVALEKSFESFWKVSDKLPSVPLHINVRTEQDLFDEGNLTSEKVVKLASSLPQGAGRRRRLGRDSVVSLTEEEDAAALFEFMRTYELALRKIPNGHVSLSLTEVVKATLEECGLADSYIDKRDALESVASVITTHSIQ